MTGAAMAGLYQPDADAGIPAGQGEQAETATLCSAQPVGDNGRCCKKSRIRNAVEISERYADGTVGDPELASVAITAWFVVRPLPTNAPAHRARWAAAWSAAPANRYFAENAKRLSLGPQGELSISCSAYWVS